MSEQKVVYEMSLKDLLTPQIKSADGAITHMEGNLHKAGETAGHFGKELISSLGIGFAIFKGFEFVHEGVEAMHGLEQAEAQVRAGLESTRGVAGLTMEALEDSARAAAAQFKYSRAQIMDMQSILLTFPGVTEKTFDSASQAIYDMSARLKTDLSSTAIQVGKALQDPIRGVTALRRVGVNFSESQTELIKKMVQGGHAAKAQAFILRELQTEFAGSAKAAADADPLFKFNKMMGSLKMGVGQLAMELLAKLTPALEFVADLFKTVFNFLRDNSEIIQDLAIGVGVAAVAWGIYELVVNASAIATSILTAATAAWNAVLSVTPLGWFLIALGAVTAAVIYCYKHFGYFQGVLMGIWELIKEFGRVVADIFTGVGKVIMGVLTFNPKMVLEGAKQTIGAIADAGTRMGKAFNKGFDEGMADFAKDQAEKNAPHTIAKKGAQGDAGADAKPQVNNPKGSKSINIRIDIKNLINEFRIQTTNITEGAARAKEMVTQALLSAVNDAQIVAGE